MNENLENVEQRSDQPQKRSISGRIVLENGLVASAVKIQLVQRRFGGNEVELAAAITDGQGIYRLDFECDSRPISLQVRVADRSEESVNLTRPFTSFSEETDRKMNLVAPGRLQTTGPEFDRMMADLANNIDGALLSDAQENDERQDFTVLNRATGWDARLIAIAAKAQNLARDPDLKELSASAIYGLLRTGFPSEKSLFTQVTADVATEALRRAIDSRIVHLSKAEIDRFSEGFKKISFFARRRLVAPSSNDSYETLLGTSGLENAVAKSFASIFFDHDGDTESLWRKAEEAGLNEKSINRLKLNGKLAFLCGNSAPMTKALMEKEISAPEDLVDGDYHLPDLWKQEIFKLADVPQDEQDKLTAEHERRLTSIIPPVYQAKNIGERVNAYATDLARKLQISYPTRVYSRRMETDNRYKLPIANELTAKVLRKASANGFQLGQTPVTRFLAESPIVMDGLTEGETQTATRELQSLQRVYQITPGDDAMPVLIKMGLESAYDVMALTEVEFTTAFNSKYEEIYKSAPQWGLAGRIRLKSEQVSSVTYNLFSIAGRTGNEPSIAAVSASPEVQQEVRKKLIKHYPTMRSLFGSIDFCECDHCRSVLSPAAYLVDLFQFVDREDQVWANFLTYWKATHQGNDYPHVDGNGVAMKPFDVLVDRRPDLPHIPLTCENTLTAMPYIDVVNEILEYYVANGTLSSDAVQDTGDATTEELLAEPQNVIKQAYESVRDAKYPLDLPMDLWMETVREFCSYFETPLSKLLETFRSTDALMDAGEPYDRERIFIESLGLSPKQAALFTNDKPLDDWYKLYGFPDEATALTDATDSDGDRIGLVSAKALSLRLDVSYKTLIEIIKTGFVNPQLQSLRIIYDLGVSPRDASFFVANKNLLNVASANLTEQKAKDKLEVEAFEAKLATYASKYHTQLATLVAQLEAIPFAQVIVLADPDAGCNFNATFLQYADGNEVKDSIVYVRINLFARLLNYLNWSIEEIDRALNLFIPANTPFDDDVNHLAQRPLRSAMIYLSHLKQLDRDLSIRKNSRIKIMTFWSDIPTAGEQPVYAKMFLRPGVLESSPVFDHEQGRYLEFLDVGTGKFKPFQWNPALPENRATGNVPLQSHLLIVQGAVGLSTEEIREILDDAGTRLEDAALSLSCISLLYRHALLARGLRISVHELIVLKQISGVDPFQPLHADVLANLAQDSPFHSTIRFVDIVKSIRECEFSIEDLDTLLRDRFRDVVKKTEREQSRLTLLQTIAHNIREIRELHSGASSDPLLDAEYLRQKLGLILAPDIVDQFLNMIDNTVEFTASIGNVDEADKLNPDLFVGHPTIVAVSHQQFPHKEQKITLRGVLTNDQKQALINQVGHLLSANQKPVFASLLDSTQQLAKDFFDNYLKKQPLRSNDEAGFLVQARFDELFAPLLGDRQAVLDAIQVRHQKVADVFLPHLRRQLVRQLVTETVAASGEMDVEPTLIEKLLTDNRLLSLADGAPLLQAFESIGDRGLSASFFDSDDLTGQAQETGRIFATADTGLKPSVASGGGNLDAANSASFAGYFEVPATGAYRFYIELEKQNAEATLSLSHLPNPKLIDQVAGNDHAVLGEGQSEYVELEAGTLYQLELQFRKLGGGLARVLVQGESLPKLPLSQLTLYPAGNMMTASHALTLVSKTVWLIDALELDENEISHILSHAADFGNVDISQFTTDFQTPVQVVIHQQFGQLMRLAKYSRLKREFAGGSSELVEVFEASKLPDNHKDLAISLIAAMTGRDEAAVRDAANAVLNPLDFKNEISIDRLNEVLKLTDRFGVSASSLADWTRIVSDVANPNLTFNIARDVKESIKARFEPENWQRVAKPIFDKLRKRQRDALVSFIMHRKNFNSQEQLYEYFLLDPEMEPVVQTSRIRLAISSVQLFVQRCLLNLEPKVHPSTLNSSHWGWIKRYRVWEANRKTFLFPENWLEPEFRDDKTHLFTELEGTLLEGDVSSDLVEDAFLTYLRGLDELARLDIIGMHIEDHPDPARRTLHIFGRTFNTPHKYFYRRYKNQNWTPWEPVDADIEGHHLAPVVWHDRLYLFWVTFMEQAATTKSSPTSGASAKIIDATMGQIVGGLNSIPLKTKITANLSWAQYTGGQWTKQETSGHASLISKIINGDFNSQETSIHVSVDFEDGEERGVKIHLAGDVFSEAFYLASRNSPVDVTAVSVPPAFPYIHFSGFYNQKVGAFVHGVKFDETLSTNPKVTSSPLAKPILNQVGTFLMTPCNNELTSLGVPQEAWEGTANPAAVKEALEAGIGEIAGLIRPIFLRDQHHTFFIDPSVTEITTKVWDGYLPKPPLYEKKPGWWKDIVVIPKEPKPWPQIPKPGPPPEVIAPGSLINPNPIEDWLVNPSTVLQVDGVSIGPFGNTGIQIENQFEATGPDGNNPILVNVKGGGEITSGGVVKIRDQDALAQSGLELKEHGLNVVGSNGFDTSVLDTQDQFNRQSSLNRFR